MVSIIKKVIQNQTYYYLCHSIRNGGKIEKKEKYIGKNIPKNIEELKKEFINEIYAEKWFPLFEKIKNNFIEQSKKLSKSAKEKELEIFTIKFTYDTQKIEGSKLTLRETADLLEKGISPGGRPIHDIKEAESHKNIFYDMLKYEKDLNLDIIIHWHRKLFEFSKPDIAGKIRQHQVAISGSKFMPPFPAEILPLLEDFFKWYYKNKTKINPIELAGLVHLKFVTIHPFADGNGRISRLLMNFILNKHNYPLLNISYENRTSYYNALERSQIKNDENIFLQWFFRRYVKEYKKYLS